MEAQLQPGTPETTLRASTAGCSKSTVASEISMLTILTYHIPLWGTIHLACRQP
jgi:hypothetical protein